VTDLVNGSARAWDERQRALGCTPRAVLFKRFPGWLNAWLHRRHVAFLLENLPLRAERILDVGCGYGRVSLAVKRERPHVAIEGVEFCAAFAEQFEKRVGRCHRVPIQEFRPEHRYEAILIVTLLMYLSEADRSQALSVLWQSLEPGGRLLCIEPAAEIAELETWISAPPKPRTPGVRRFRMAELATTCDRSPARRCSAPPASACFPGSLPRRCTTASQRRNLSLVVRRDLTHQVADLGPSGDGGLLELRARRLHLGVVHRLLQRPEGVVRRVSPVAHLQVTREGPRLLAHQTGRLGQALALLGAARSELAGIFLPDRQLPGVRGGAELPRSLTWADDELRALRLTGLDTADSDHGEGGDRTETIIAAWVLFFPAYAGALEGQADSLG
jgi:SAM-dependent methyltransferase